MAHREIPKTHCYTCDRCGEETIHHSETRAINDIPSRWARVMTTEDYAHSNRTPPEEMTIRQNLFLYGLAKFETNLLLCAGCFKAFCLLYSEFVNKKQEAIKLKE